MFGDLTPRTLIEIAPSPKDAMEAREKRKVEEELQKLDMKAGEQLIRETEGLKAREVPILNQRQREHLDRHNTFDPRGTPTREGKKGRRNNTPKDARENRENDRKRGYKWLAREDTDIGNHKAGEPGFPTNHRNQESTDYLPDAPTAPLSKVTRTPQGPRFSVFGLKDITHTNQLSREPDPVDQKISHSQVIINGLPPSKRRTDQ